MRVLLDTTAARHAPSGTGVYVTRLTAALRELGVDVVAVANERRRPPGTGSSRRNAAEDVRWVQRDLRRLAREHDVDVVHHPLPALTAHGPRPQVVTVHDLAFEALPAAFDPRFRRYAQVAHRLAAQRAAAVVVPSEATRAELAARWGRTGAVLAPHGPGQALPPRERAATPQHFLYVGDGEPRKDLPTLLAAHARYRSTARDPLPLVLAGTAYAVDSGVRVVERPDPDALATLYAQAAALVHPSRHEGFGLTVLEALTAGTPVIAADIPAVREITSEARFVAPCDVDALAAALRDPPQSAPAPRRQLTWRASAERHLEAYRRAVGDPID
jgi:glycosyltransferase involved in cell wall biosynthesis